MPYAQGRIYNDADVSSDYPHIEGGRNPLKRFEESMAAFSTMFLICSLVGGPF